MQPARSTRIPDGFMAATRLGAEKPHQGVRRKNPTPDPGHNRRNLRNALGLRACFRRNRVRSRCSGEQYDPDLGLYYLRARYYNPLTGRFMSRDPRELCDCSLDNPNSLHAYLYASDDPVDRVDPTGREAAAEGEEIEGEIDLGVVGRKTIPKGAAWGGIGLTGVGLEIACMYYTEGAGVGAVGLNIGGPQTVTLLGNICSAVSSKVPGEPLGPYPEPFFPDMKWATAPGNPWGDCEANAEDWILSCRKRCPDGGEESLTWDDGTKTGEPPHWDYHRCNNTTCKIYLDGTSTCPPE